MKSRTSFFNGTVFKKNLTRFAPAWALYGVFLLMSLLVMSGNGSKCARELSYVAESLACLTFPYALLVALLLFGDLYNSRICNALHAMPVRRESLFVTNLVSGLCFSLIPTLVALIFGLALSQDYDLLNSTMSPLLCFAVMNLQYLFFFGTAVLCAFLVGNRFAMALVYGILNFASMLVYWFVDTLYTPLLYGLRTAEEPFILLCPVAHMLRSSYVDHVSEFLGTDENGAIIQSSLVIGDGWEYLGICAAIGVAFMGLALLLYRRRKLECAGDFMAEKAGEPVFLTVYSLVMGAVFQFFWSIFIGNDTPVFLFVGLAVGFFTGLMLLKRTVRVFRGKAFAGCTALMAAMVLSLAVTALDPLGLESWMPQAGEIKSVTLYQGFSLNKTQGYELTLEDAEDIEAILQVHEAALTLHNGAVDADGYVSIGPGEEKVHVEDLRGIAFTLEYRLENGTVVRRYYSTWVQTEAGDILKDFFSSVECVLGVPESELAQLAEELDLIKLDSYEIRDDQEQLSLLQAIAADCEAGTMAQSWAFRDDDGAWENIMDIYCASDVDLVKQDVWYYGSRSVWFTVQVFEANENVLNWMSEHNVPTYQELREKYPYG